MKPLVVLVGIFAAASAGSAVGGGFSGGFGLGGGSGGYPVGNVGGGYSGGGGGGFSTGGSGAHFGNSHNAPLGFSGAGNNAASGFGGGFNNGGGNFVGGGGGGGNFNANDGIGNSFGGGGQIRKFVSVHVGPDEPQFTQTKVIRAGGIPDKHVNIIFVKAPSAAAAQNTEVILPEIPQQKTLVYVLVKKQESTSNVRVRGPSPVKPSKPEVYFIRYKDGSSTAPGAGGVVGGGVQPGFGGAGISGAGALPNIAPGPGFIPAPHHAVGVVGGGYQ